MKSYWRSKSWLSSQLPFSLKCGYFASKYLQMKIEKQTIHNSKRASLLELFPVLPIKLHFLISQFDPLSYPQQINMRSEQPPPKKEIKSMKQISQEARLAKKQFDLLINFLSIPNMTMEEDLQKQNPTIDRILSDLPSEQKLKDMLDHPFADTAEIRQKRLTSYKGKYKIIQRAVQNIKNLKYQTERLYFLAAQLNLAKIQNQFSDPKKGEEIRLKSCEISNNQNLRLPRYERNMISPTYLRQLKTEELKASINTNTADYLNIGETLIHINLYDSINGQKAFEYVCYGQQTLLEVVSKFYCLIAKLQQKQATHQLNSFCLIEQSFYFNGALAKKKIAQIIAFSNQSMQQEYHGQQESQKLVFQMGKTKLKNLRVVFGRPYLFRHLEGCDHILIFKDLRILTENQFSDPIKKDKYPLIVFEGRMRRRKCDGCRTKFAEHVSLNDPLKGGKHLYVCAMCHRNLHAQATNETHTFIQYLHD